MVGLNENERSCPVCAGTDAPVWAVKGSLRLVRCRHCSMVYADPVSADLATGAWYGRRAESYYLAPEKLAGDHAAIRFERELALFRASCRQGAVLDVGCSSGGFLNQLRGRYPDSYTVLGVDVPSVALDHAESLGIPVARDSFVDLNLGDRRFAAITFWAVMEHLVSPAVYLSKAAQLLEPGGHGFILVPNLHSLAVRCLGLRYRYITSEHVNYFAVNTLADFGRRERSLETVAIVSIHFNPLVIIQDWRRRQEKVPDAERLRLFARTTRYKQSRLLKPLKMFYDLAEAALGRMKLADNLVLVLRKKS